MTAQLYHGTMEVSWVLYDLTWFGKSFIWSVTYIYQGTLTQAQKAAVTTKKRSGRRTLSAYTCSGGQPHPFHRFGRYGILSIAERKFCIQTCGRYRTWTLTSTATGHLCGSVSRNSVKVLHVQHMKELSFPSSGTVYATLFPFLLHYYSHLYSLLLLLVEN